MSMLMEQIISLVESALGKAPSSLDASAAMDITEGWDSLKTMEILIAVEKQFQITFSAKQMMALDSIGSIHDTLLSMGVQGC